MSKAYQRMSLAGREELSIQQAQGLGIRTIARQLGRSPSTISRELTRNRTGFDYRAVTAQRKAERRCFRKPRRLAVDGRLRHTVFSLLRRQWSPEQIRDRLRRQYPHEPSLQVSAETIYSYLYGCREASCAASC